MEFGKTRTKRSSTNSGPKLVTLSIAKGSSVPSCASATAHNKQNYNKRWILSAAFGFVAIFQVPTRSLRRTPSLETNNRYAR